jgi:drug/metabolite transporter (DMT)-like permease
MTRRSWALFAAMCLVWGIPYLLIRVAVRDLAPGTLVFLRTGIGGLLLLPFALRVGGFGRVLRRWRPLVLFTVLEMAAPWLLLSDAERRLSSSLSGLLIAAVPLLGAVIARLTGARERVEQRQLIGLLVGLVGVALLVGLDVGQVHLGALLEVLGVVIGYAVGPVVLTRRLADLPSLPVVSVSLLMVAIGYLPYAALRPPTGLPADAWWSVIVLAVVCTALAFVLFFALIAAIGPTRATVITYVNPAVAVLAGVLLLDEDLTLGIGVGFPLILAGSVLAARRRVPPPSPEAAICETVDESVALAQSVSGQSVSAQSMRTGPDAVSNSTATTPVSPPSGSTQSTVTPSSGSAAEVPR